MQEKQLRFPDDFGSREPTILFLQNTDAKKSFQQDYGTEGHTCTKNR